MYLPESIGWALEHEEVSTVKISCKDDIKEEVAKYFGECLAEEWKKACEKVEAEYGELEDNDVLIYASVVDYGVCVYVSTVEIRYSYGDYCDLQYGSDALNYALKDTKKKYSEIEYEGYIVIPWSDVNGGQVDQWAISSTGKEVASYDFIGVVLNSVLKREEHIWERVEDRDVDELIFTVTGKLKYFENREEITEYIEDLGATVSSSVSKNTSYLINNDVNSDSSKNKKAKELNIPIITEAEFIARFGDPDEYDIDVECSDFWYKMSSELCENEAEVEEYEAVIDVLYAHSEWIEKDVLHRTIFSLIDMAMETDPENQELLLEYVEKLESGESNEKEDEFEDSLPDGYMLALQAAMEADEYEKELEHNGFMLEALTHEKNQVFTLSEESYPRISAKAKDGDAKAIKILEMIRKANE